MEPQPDLRPALLMACVEKAPGERVVRIGIDKGGPPDPQRKVLSLDFTPSQAKAVLRDMAERVREAQPRRGGLLGWLL